MLREGQVMMDDSDAQVSELDSPQEPVSTLAEPATQLELRILSGSHQGASLRIESGTLLRVGCSEICDVLLSDCGVAAALQLIAQGSRWLVLASPDAQASEDGQTGTQSYSLGAVGLLGQVYATVCAEDAPWQAFEPLPSAQEAGRERATAAAEVQAFEEDDSAAAAASMLTPMDEEWQPRASVPAPRSLGWRWKLPAMVLVVLVAVWGVWRSAAGSADVTEGVSAQVPVQPGPSRVAQDKAVKEASLAIALVDPGLRMKIVPNAQGGVNISGWVSNVEQLDRLAQGLSALRPLPHLSVRTLAEVIDSLADAGAENARNLEFSLQGEGKVQAKGVVADLEAKQLTLAQLRAHAPEGVEVLDGLRVASLQGPKVRQWLQEQGMQASRVEWDGEQLVLAVDVSAQQRPQLERLLAATESPLAGVPFLLQTRIIDTAMKRMTAAAAGLPFRIRSVVGGAAPYVVLADGTKLQPGGSSAGWRLVTVAQEYLIFDGPKRVEIGR